MPIHDGVVVGYTIIFLKQELLLDIEPENGEMVTVTFANYLAHSFDHVMAGSILFDIERADLNVFLKENREQFENFKLYAWPIWYDNINNLEQFLRENNYKCYIITSSLGLNGYVLAKSFKISKGN